MSPAPPGLARLLPMPLRTGTLAAVPGSSITTSAVSLFADVSGFTAMSEALARHETVGTEQMADLVNAFFAPAVDAVECGGGYVAYFAGDALCAVFPYGSDDRHPAGASESALAAANEIQRIARGFVDVETEAGTFSLTVKVGIGAGEVTTLVAGDTHALRYATLGPGVLAATDAESRASPGDVVHALGGSTVAAHAHLPVRQPVETPASAVADAVVRAFVDDNLVERLMSDHGAALVDEHRTVTVAFVRMETGREAEATRFASLIESALPATAHFGGNLLSARGDDKGATLTICFGAPVAHSDDAARALGCLDAIRDDSDDTVAAGVATGTVFCGLVGSERRAEYTLVGDTANLAARLMQAAEPGEIVADTGTWTACGQTFTRTEPRTLHVKGRTAPVEVASLTGTRTPRRPDPVASAPLVGRRGELRVLEACTGDAATGSGRAVAIIGPPGIGKSSLIGKAADLAGAAGFSVVTSGFDVTTTRAAYAGLRLTVRGILDLAAPPLDGSERLEDRLSRLYEDLGQAAEVLAPVLGASLAGRSHPTRLDPAQASELLRATILRLIGAATRVAPLMIVVDDCHWADAASHDLLTFLMRRSRSMPVLLLLAGRPDADWIPAGELATHLALGPLPDADAAALVDLELSQTGASSHGLSPEMIIGRAGGNPLFIRELAAHLAQLPADDDHVSMPDTLTGLVSAEIDRLPEAERTALAMASVFGREFEAADFTACFGTRQWESGTSLGALAEGGQLRPTSEGAERLSFSSDTLSEVAYARLSHATRRSLHDRIGLHFEGRHADHIDEWLDVLAHHFGLSANVAKQRTYFGMAATRAKSLYANESAIDYLERLIPLVEDAERVGAQLDLAEILEHTGAWPRAVETVETALEGSSGAMAARAEALLGRIHLDASRFDVARACLERAIATASACGAPESELAALDTLSIVTSLHGDFADSQEFARRQHELALALSPQGVGSALLNVAAAAWDRGDQDAAIETVLEAREWCVANSEERLLCDADIQLAVYLDVRVPVGDLGEVMRYLAEAGEIARRTGFEYGLVRIMGNEANLRMTVGDDLGALDLGLTTLELALDLDDRLSCAHMLGLTSELHRRGGDPARGAELLEPTASIARECGHPALIADVLVEQAQTARSLGQFATARSYAEEANSVGHDANRLAAELGAELAVITAFEAGELTREDALERLTSATEGLEHMQARAMAAFHLWELSGDEAARNSAAELHEALYALRPESEIRTRHHALTGEWLPKPPSLPPLELDHAPPALEALLVRARATL